MARAGLVLAATHDLIESSIRPGISTAELDKLAERFIRSQGATPTFKGYRGFPGSICASPNAMIVHGIPGSYRLKSGDVISIDIGVTLDGWVADAARTFAVDGIDQEAQKLLEVTEQSLYAAVAQCRDGNRMAMSRALCSRWSRAPASRSCARSSAMAWGATCTRTRRCPTTERPERARRSKRGWCLRSSR